MNKENKKVRDVIIIGGGPAGLSAALYGARSGVDVLVLDKYPAVGALGYARRIENYPGVIKPVSGIELLSILQEHAHKFGAQLQREQVVNVELKTNPKKVVTYDNVYHTKSIIVATGAMARGKFLPGEEELLGKGVSYCAACDAPFFKDKKVALAGSAREIEMELPAIYKYAAKVFLILRGELNEKIAEVYEENGKVKFYEKHRLKEIKGNKRVKNISIYGKDGGKELEVDGVFIFMPGNKPEVGFLNNQLASNKDGCIKVDYEDMSTSINGVYAAGDVTCKKIRQCSVAVGEGSIAAISAATHAEKKY